MRTRIGKVVGHIGEKWLLVFLSFIKKEASAEVLGGILAPVPQISTLWKKALGLWILK
jgi:hypothetical protein